MIGRCGRCEGSGRCWYANTAAWHDHSIAWQELTEDVCDCCWGSGDPANPGENLLLKERAARARWLARYKEDAAFRWKERARRFQRRYRNVLSNYRELQKELQRVRDELAEERAREGRL